MQETKKTETYNLIQFVVLAFTTLADLALDAIAYVALAVNGASITIGRYKAGETYIDDGKRHELGSVTSLGGNSLLVSGTPEIENNPALAAALFWVQRLMKAANRTCAFFTPTGPVEYFIMTSVDKAVILLKKAGFAQISAVVQERGGGLVARDNNPTHRSALFFLAANDAINNRVERPNWKRIEIPGVEQITNLPVIDDPRFVLCNAVINSKPASVMLDLTEIASGQIRTIVSASDTDTARYLGRTVGNRAIVEADQTSHTFDPGVHYANAGKLVAAYGKPGERLASARVTKAQQPMI